MTDAQARLDVDRGLCIVLTVASGAAVFVAEALHGERSAGSAGTRPHSPSALTVAAAATTVRRDIGLEIVFDDRVAPDVSRDEPAVEPAVELASSAPATPVLAHHAAVAPRAPSTQSFAQEVKRASRSNEALVATRLTTIRANASAVQPAPTEAHAMK